MLMITIVFFALFFSHYTFAEFKTVKDPYCYDDIPQIVSLEE